MGKEREELVKHIFTADPSARVFDGKIYIYPSHDIPHDGEDNDNGDEYQMRDYHVLSMDNLEAECIDNGEALNEKDVPWVSEQLWAPDAVCVDGKYYLVFPARDKNGDFRLGVAVSDNPAGPFKPEENYIEGSYSIDPGLLQEDNGDVYVYYGGLWGGQLEKWQLGYSNPGNPDPEPERASLGPMFAKMSKDMKSFVTEPINISILDENGEPIKAGDEERRFFEDSWINKINGKYYLSYSTGTTHYIVYATSDKREGPYTYQGRILEPVIGWTTHHSIMEYNGKYYLFYHDCELSNGINHRRCVKYLELTLDENGKFKTVDPYSHKK